MHHLTLEMNDQEGALRLLGTTERRGWRSVGVNASARDGRLTVTLTVAAMVRWICSAASSTDSMKSRRSALPPGRSGWPHERATTCLLDRWGTAHRR